MDPKTGISEPTVVIPWWLDCREDSWMKIQRLGLDRAIWKMIVPAVNFKNLTPNDRGVQ